MYNSSLILEGGGNRGVFTAGVLDFLMEQDVKFAYVAGVSAGSCNAVDYLSEQIGRTRDCMIVEDKDKKAFDLMHVLKTGDIFNMEMIFDKYPNEYFPFDYDKYFASEMHCDMVATNCETGEAEYLSETTGDRDRLMKICRASSSLPTVSNIVEIDGKKYLDGGVADSIPIIHAMKLGYHKNVLILTREKGYRKSKSSKGSIAINAAVYKEYPNLVNTLYNRHRQYNRTLELIEKWEEEGHIFVIRPEEVTVGRVESNIQKLKDFYQHGYDTMKEQYEALKEYLESPE